MIRDHHGRTAVETLLVMAMDELLGTHKVRQARPDLDRFFTNDRLRGFFVKSLESVQGDERDALIFSIGYGPDENRKITMNFGPLNKQGGRRRLNVAITRARYRNEIVTSIRASDIPESITTEGLRHLRRYLDYAARGMPALALDTSSGGTQSPRSKNRSSVSSGPGDTSSPRRSVPPDTASTSACATPTTPASTSSASNVTATSTTPPKSPATVIRTCPVRRRVSVRPPPAEGL
jgi:hypothetical protein